MIRYIDSVWENQKFILRQGGFYTGASIGVPEFSVQSQGSNGTVRPALTVPIGEDVIPFVVTVGAAPEIGSLPTATRRLPCIAPP